MNLVVPRILSCDHKNLSTVPLVGFLTFWAPNGAVRSIESKTPFKSENLRLSNYLVFSTFQITPTAKSGWCNLDMDGSQLSVHGRCFVESVSRLITPTHEEHGFYRLEYYEGIDRRSKRWSVIEE